LQRGAEPGAVTLLHEQVQPRLLGRGQLEAAPAERTGGGEAEQPLAARSGRVALDGEVAPVAPALAVGPPAVLAEHARSEQQHIDARRRLDEAEGKDVAGGEADRGALAQVRRNVMRNRPGMTSSGSRT
jgi:hypothetical protein